MEVDGDFMHLACSRESENGFDLVAVPYRNKVGRGEKCTRYMIYLVPKMVNTDLDGLWREFRQLTKDGIGELLNNCDLKEVNLIVPKIDGLKSTLISNVLKTTYYPGPPREYVDSTMSACIDVDEEGTVAKALAIAVCEDCLMEKNCKIKVDRPYIAIVYDRNIGFDGRILFVVKDMGVIGNS